MFTFAILTGLYSYLIFFLGIFGILYKETIFLFSLVFLMITDYFLFFVKSISITIPNFKNFSKLSIAIAMFLLTQAAVNLIGVLGPEIAFDSLWYHLTIPKLFLIDHSISFVPGGLLYYSLLPKLTEMLYIPALSFGNEISAKLIHYVFGLLVSYAIYKLSRRILPIEYSLLSSVIFYSNLVVGWESISSYIDLSRTFFELLSFYAFILYFESTKNKWLYASSLLLGFAIAAKLSAVFSLLIFIPLILYIKMKEKSRAGELLKSISVYISICIVVVTPWFIFSYLNTGNPIYPYFTIPVDSGRFLSLPTLTNLKTFFLNLSDPISPIYLIILPIIVILFKKFTSKEKLFATYSSIAFFLWLLTQEERGSRFLLPYLPVFSVICSVAIFKLKDKGLKIYLITTILVISLVSIFYRGIANAKFVPVLTGYESKREFLSKNLNFSYGDFYDTDGYFESHIKDTDNVLLYGFHNLYYINFPFIDSSWVKKGDKFNYIATQNSTLPSRFSVWNKIYYNKTTGVSLFTMKGEMWEF